MSNGKDIIAGPWYTGLQKIISFFSPHTQTTTMQISKKKRKEKGKTEKEADLVCKNRQKRQIT